MLPIGLFAQSATYGEKYAVSIKISSFTNSSVSFTWTSDAIVSTSIYRKTITSSNWSRLKRNHTSQSYSDNSITTGTEYEYKFEVNTGTTPSLAYGYISFGVKVPQKTSRGNMLLVVDSRFESSIATEIDVLKEDLLSDGWNTLVTFVSKDTTVPYVKAVIDSINSANSLDGIYLIGHIPVPYSGLYYPDGHPDHKGAWPTDLYYASDANDWTDNLYNYTNSTRPVNSNLINDGKFDNTEIVGETFCAISRIDFYNLPKAENSELTTLKNYLTKASSYKHGEIETNNKGLIDDNLAAFSEGFSFNGHMNFGSLFGDSVDQSSFLSALTTETYKWGYACGYGSDSSLSGIGTATTLKNTDYQGIFSMVFGSYFGDWNTEDNFMRSLLADGKMLTTCWAGRPNWFFHHMGLNNPIATSAKMSVENSSNSSYLSTTSYDIYGNYSNGVHMQLLGDLSLRQNYSPTLGTFEATYNSSSSNINLSWDAPSNGSIEEYQIYKSQDSLSNYTLFAVLSGTDSTFTDTTIYGSGNYYYISYVTLDSTLSGSYYNSSLGSFVSLDTTGVASGASTVPVELFSFDVKENNGNGILNWSTAAEINSSHFELEKSINARDWIKFDHVQGAGNSNSIIEYQSIDYKLGNVKTYYRLRLLDFDGNYDYSGIRVIDKIKNRLVVYPNPSISNKLSLVGLSSKISTDKVRIIDSRGMEVPFILSGPNNEHVEIQHGTGVYYLEFKNEFVKFIIL